MTLTAPEQNVLAPVLAALPRDLHDLLSDAVSQIAEGRAAEERAARAETESRVTWMSEVLGGVASAFQGLPGHPLLGLRDLPTVADKVRKAAVSRGWDGR